MQAQRQDVFRRFACVEGHLTDARRVACTARHRGRGLLFVLLVAVLLGAHATHLPMMAYGHASWGGESEHGISSGGGIHAGHEGTSRQIAPSKAGGVANGLVHLLGAWDSAMDELRCLAETIATVPRTLLALLLVFGGTWRAAAISAGASPGRPVPVPLPPADRRRALLQVYLI